MWWRQGMALCMQLQLAGWAAATTGESISACSEILLPTRCGLRNKFTCINTELGQE
jgi:hypothetical protein